MIVEFIISTLAILGRRLVFHPCNFVFIFSKYEFEVSRLVKVSYVRLILRILRKASRGLEGLVLENQFFIFIFLGLYPFHLSYRKC